ncbi:hypothetical protein PV326_013305, partial [Microctonus aethiopoides]
LDNADNISKICHHHRCQYFDYYSWQFRKFHDPFNVHKRIIRRHLRVLNLGICMSALSQLAMKIIPGDKVCKRCENVLREKILLSEEKTKQSNVNEESEKVQNQPELRKSVRTVVQKNISNQEIVNCSQRTNSSSYMHISSNESEFITVSQDERAIDSVLATLDLPIYKQQVFYKKRTQFQAENLIQQISDKFAEKLSKAADFEIEILDPMSTNLYEDNVILKKIIQNLKFSFDNAENISKIWIEIIHAGDPGSHNICVCAQHENVMSSVIGYVLDQIQISYNSAPYFIEVVSSREHQGTRAIFKMEVIVDMQEFKWRNNEFIVKEFAMIQLDNKDDHGTHILFKSPCKWDDLPRQYKVTNSWVIRNYDGIYWEDGDIPYDKLRDILEIIMKDKKIINIEKFECPSMKNVFGSNCKYNSSDI